MDIKNNLMTTKLQLIQNSLNNMFKLFYYYIHEVLIRKRDMKILQTKASAESSKKKFAKATATPAEVAKILFL